MSSVPGKDSRFVLSFFKPFCPSTGGRQGRVPRFWFPTGFSLARRLGLCSFRFAAAVTSLPWYAQASLPLKATQGWVLSGQSLARQARRSAWTRFWSPGLDAPREVSQAHARSSVVKPSSSFSSLGTVVVRLLQVFQ
jgi:hypothetical protein